ncbi:hypothetical protein BO85DRAFT_447162 [Aspergillus piperis CBS 112811]|uniref:Uncharacterized protein n=1 Tax=Aspergillus piperis CBS 112811 TaxID=1448313 RepID=A0A8G1R7F3_9EURO|nr:hypothetical protein BO85DRAFT_447162 [Aspergillus piperis CBS 112811]RAH60587.1 hypothetical protein BO85DRAFT_447162 [Aspergillus piperis CBS 112811]
MKLLSIFSTALFVAAVAAAPLAEDGSAPSISENAKRDDLCPSNACYTKCINDYISYLGVGPAFGLQKVDCMKQCGCL